MKNITELPNNIPNTFQVCETKIPEQVNEVMFKDLDRFIKVEVDGPTFVINFEDGTKSYVEKHHELYDRGSPGLTKFESLRLVDVDKNDEIIGYGIVTLWVDDPDDEFTSRPFVDFTRTIDDYRKKGFGKRRLISMNTASRQFFNLPLYASRAISEEALRLWQNLEKDGLVIHSDDTYRFK